MTSTTRARISDKARGILSAISSAEREEMLVKCWMSHDARWFTAVAQAFGIEAANRLNQIAVREAGKAEVRRVFRALRLPPPASVDDYLLAQEVMIGLLGPELLDYEVVKTGENAFEFRIRRCFAHENVTRAGVSDLYECGIFARVCGWIEALGLPYEMAPALGKCPKVQGRECVYAFSVPGAGAPAGPGG